MSTIFTHKGSVVKDKYFFKTNCYISPAVEQYGYTLYS